LAEGHTEAAEGGAAASHKERSVAHSTHSNRGAGGSGMTPEIAAVASIDLSGIDVKKLTDGINKFGQTADKLSDLSSAVAATSALSERMQQATVSVAGLSESYEQHTQVLTESVGFLSGSYQKAAETIITSSKQAGDKIIASTKQVVSVADAAAEGFAATFTAVDQQIKATLDGLKHSSAGYNKHMESLNKNMTALNTVYEMQAKETAKCQKHSAEFGKQLETFATDLHRSAEENQAFLKGITRLSENITELNSIYGNMLSAVHSANKKVK
jgi:chromosome segregation ATPase